MSGAVLIAGILSLLFGWLLHLVWWRVSRPRDDLMAVGVCMVLVPSFLMFALYLGGRMDLTEVILSMLLASSAGTAYVFWYPAAQAASPTMLVTILAGQAGKKGVTGEILKEALSEETLSGNSLQSLLDERFARQDDSGCLQLAPRGKRTLFIIRLLRRSAGFGDPKG